MLHMARRWLRRIGFDVVRFNEGHATFALLEAMSRTGVTQVLDVGAHFGEWAQWVRAQGWRGPIHSFEPNGEAFRILSATSSRDPRWQAIHTAVGDTTGKVTLKVRRNSQASSIRDANNLLPDDVLEIVRTEDVDQVRLDDVLKDHSVDAHYLLKCDVQGYEDKVIGGAENILPVAPVVLLETTLRRVYSGEMLLPEMIERMRQLGYQVEAVRPVYFSPRNHELLNVDVLFVRDGAASRL